MRPKGNLSPAAAWALAALAVLPLFTMSVRTLGLPGMLGPELGGFQAIGSALNQALSLNNVPPDQRDHVLYLLLLPTCALVVALARLTFGIRVLGFRSILISVAFHQSGVLASLLLITVSVATVVLVRPWLRQIRLPYYARVSVILCIVATTMVGAVLLGPWIRSDIAWGVAYFPVIVLGMLAEGIARTLDRDNVVAASWRAITTILLAFLIALICWIPALRGLLLQFPELVVTQIVAIVMVSEFLDLRLLHGWDARVARTLLAGPSTDEDSFRVAVVRNRLDPASRPRFERLGARRQALRSVQGIVDALRQGGHVVQVMEGDSSLSRELRRFLPGPRPGQAGGIVLNLAQGRRGEAPSTHVPALLEMSGAAYVGPTPWGHAVASDRFVSRVLMRRAGVPTPSSWLMTGPRDGTRRIRYPATVRPRYEPGARPVVVEDPRALRGAVKRIARRYRQDAVVEERLAGRRLAVAMLGNQPVECLPLVELVLGEKVCPAVVDAALAQQIRECATAAFWACGCRDYARIDVCVLPSGGVCVLGVQTLGILARGGAFARAGAQAGYPFEQLVCRIIEVARERGHADEPMRPVLVRPRAATAGPIHRPRGSRSRGEAARRDSPQRSSDPGPSPTVSSAP